MADSSQTEPVGGHPAAIILAGGAGRRLGAARPPAGKAACEVGGRSLLAHVVAAVAPVIDELLVVGGPRLSPDLTARHPQLRQVVDSQPGAGPLAAVRDGLAAISHRRAERGLPLPAAVLLVAADLPLVRPPLVQALLAQLPPTTGWLIPQVGSQPQYLFSVLRPALLEPLEAFLASGRRDLRGFAAEQHLLAPGRVVLIPPEQWRRVDPESAAARDIDTPADLADIAGSASQPG